MNNERRRLLPKRGRSVQFQGGDEGTMKCKVRWACATILIAETLERVTFYSIIGNLVLFLNKEPYSWMSYNAANASFFLFGVSYTMSLFGGWIADTVLGRSKTILVSFVIYLGGCAFLPFLSSEDIFDGRGSVNGTYPLSLPGFCAPPNRSEEIVAILNETVILPLKDPFTENCAWAVYVALCIIAIGSGAVKATIAPFGADQLKNSSPKAMRAFFNWFYWCVNLGAFIALGGISYLQQQVKFFYGYLVACCCLGAAILLFLCGCTVYVTRPPSGSILTNVCKVLCDSCKTSRSRADSDLDWFANARGVTKVGCLDRAKMQYGGRFTDGIVEDVKQLLKILCVFIFMIPYWMVYFQMETTFYIQGLHMRLTFNDDHSKQTHHGWDNPETPQVAVAWLTLFDVVFVIILIPFMDRLVYPRLDRAGYHFSMAMRMMLGMCFATVAVAVAGGVETRRLELFWPNKTVPSVNRTIFQKIAGTEYQAADMSIFWQIPQYALIGISEVFTSIAALEFAYSKAPKSMKGIIMGMFFFFSGMGSLLGTALLYMFNGVWFFGQDGGDINCRYFLTDKRMVVSKACHLDYYFYFLAGLEIFGLFLFMIVTKCLNFQVDSEANRLANQRAARQRHEPEKDFFIGQDRPSVRSGLLHGDT